MSALWFQVRVFIGGEFSGVVRDAFIARGHDAMSCDLRPTERPGPHHQGSWFDPEIMREQFDLGIFHPDCTFLTVSANRWFDDWRVEARLAALHTVRAIWAMRNFKKLAIENPIGVLSTFWRRPDQVIQPSQFGDPFRKATCLWLRGDLPLLVATNDLGAGEQACWKEPPSPERKKNRSRTYPGIASAFADQWGNEIVERAAARG